MNNSAAQQKQSRNDTPGPVIAYYGDGEKKLGPLLTGFLGTLATSGQRTELCEIMTSYGSDKGSQHHNYTLLYHFLFDPLRTKTERMFELGLGSNFIDTPSNMGRHGTPGASLRGWRQFFPNAQITGADVDKRVLFSEDRIATYYTDQISKPDIDSLWKNFPDTKFDIMIDDGWHEFEPNIIFIYNSLKKLKPNGYYIIEDIGDSEENLDRYNNYFSKCRADGALVKLPIAGNQPNNCVAIFQPEAPSDPTILIDPAPYLKLAERKVDRESWAREHPHHEGWRYHLQRWHRSLIKRVNILRRLAGMEDIPLPSKF